MRLWRVATETRLYRADDLSGEGAARNPGRWNDNGEPVIYAAQSVALAMLETAAYVDDAGLPLNRYLVQIDLPADVWARRARLDLRKLPPTWSAIPAGHTRVRLGSAWLASLRSPLLMVPSVIVPEERVALINPKHSACARITAWIVRPMESHRLFRS